MKLKMILTLFWVSTTVTFANNIAGNTPLCPEATLQSYLNSYGSGLSGGSCAIGQLSFAKFDWAAFNVLSNNSSLTIYDTIKPADLILKPVEARNSFDIIPVAGKETLFNRTINAGKSERYFFTYNVDPPPIIAGDELFLDPPIGSIYGTKWICADQPFANLPGGQSIAAYVPGLSRGGYTAQTFGCGSGSTDAYFLQTDGDPSTAIGVQSRVLFSSPAAYINVRLLLDFEPGTITGFDGIQIPVVTTVPEPATVVMMGIALAGLATISRNRRKS